MKWTAEQMAYRIITHNKDCGNKTKCAFGFDEQQNVVIYCDRPHRLYIPNDHDEQWYFDGDSKIFTNKNANAETMKEFAKIAVMPFA